MRPVNICKYRGDIEFCVVWLVDTEIFDGGDELWSGSCSSVSSHWVTGH